MERVYKTSTHVGWFYSWSRGSADAILLACQVVGILFAIGWVGGLMAPFFWTLHYFGYLRSDPLEEVVGLDIGYTGGNKKARNTEESEARMNEYLKEYEHRKRERAYFKKLNKGMDGSNGSKTSSPSGIPASSIHNQSLHGNSYHGRRIISSTMIESLDTVSNTLDMNGGMDQANNNGGAVNNAITDTEDGMTTEPNAQP